MPDAKENWVHDKRGIDCHSIFRLNKRPDLESLFVFSISNGASALFCLQIITKMTYLGSFLRSSKDTPVFVVQDAFRFTSHLLKKITKALWAS